MEDIQISFHQNFDVYTESEKMNEIGHVKLIPA